MAGLVPAIGVSKLYANRTPCFAANPPELLATNFDVPASTFSPFPKGETPMPD